MAIFLNYNRCESKAATVVGCRVVCAVANCISKCQHFTSWFWEALTGGDGRILQKISALHLLGKTYRIKPFSSSSISLDSTFNLFSTLITFCPISENFLKDLGQFSNAATIRLTGQKIEILILQVYILQWLRWNKKTSTLLSLNQASKSDCTNSAYLIQFWALVHMPLD